MTNTNNRCHVKRKNIHSDVRGKNRNSCTYMMEMYLLSRPTKKSVKTYLLCL